jgi:hypothetical protein
MACCSRGYVYTIWCWLAAEVYYVIDVYTRLGTTRLPAGAMRLM